MGFNKYHKVSDHFLATVVGSAFTKGREMTQPWSLSCHTSKMYEVRPMEVGNAGRKYTKMLSFRCWIYK